MLWPLSSSSSSFSILRAPSLLFSRNFIDRNFSPFFFSFFYLPRKTHVNQMILTRHLAGWSRREEERGRRDVWTSREKKSQSWSLLFPPSLDPSLLPLAARDGGEVSSSVLKPLVFERCKMVFGEGEEEERGRRGRDGEQRGQRETRVSCVSRQKRKTAVSSFFPSDFFNIFCLLLLPARSHLMCLSVVVVSSSPLSPGDSRTRLLFLLLPFFPVWLNKSHVEDADSGVKTKRRAEKSNYELGCPAKKEKACG